MRWPLALLLGFALATVPAAALAADDDPPPVSIESAIGAGGYVRPDAGFTLTLDLTSTRLVAGLLRVQLGNEVFVEDVELPAGTTKTYALELPAPRGQRRVVVDITESEADSALASSRITLQVASDALVVGVAGDDGLLTVIDSVTSSPFNQEVVAVAVTGNENLAPLDYLVVADPACCDADAIREWVDGGGRLIAASPSIDVLGLLVPSGHVITGTAAAVSREGSGEIIAWEDPASGDATAWRAVLRSVPPAETGLNNMGGGFVEGSNLFEAAVASGSNASLELSWLLAALAGYVIIAGPVNFLLLRRFGRMEWAWVTIPAIGVLAISALVLVGRQQTASLHVTQASVIVESDSRMYAESGIVYFAANEGTHTLGFGRDFSARASQGTWFASTSGATVARTAQGGTELTFELPSLGAATAYATWHPEPTGIRLSSQVTEEGVQVAITNDGSNTYWAWGLVAGQRVVTESTPLAPGDEATLELRPGGRVADPWSSPIADSIMSRVGGSDQNWQRVWPLAFTATQLASSQLGDAVYFFGITDDPTVPLTTRGQSAAARGSSLVVVDTGLDAGSASGESIAELVATDGQVETSNPQAAWVYGASYANLRFRVPDDTGALELDFTNFGGPASPTDFEVWNWTSAAFDALEIGDSFDPSDHRSAAGEVMVSFELSNQAEMSVSSYALTWEDA
jgi:hypothetical protein